MTTRANFNVFAMALFDVLKSDYDAVEAYAFAMNKVSNKMYLPILKLFKQDHEDHIILINRFIQDHHIKVPNDEKMKSALPKIKVYLGNLMGDTSILLAIASSEANANQAYERINLFEERWPEIVETLKRHLDDEVTHKVWFESIFEKKVLQ